MPETELIKKLWPPDGKQPTTATPKITTHEGIVTITCDSAGASIAYRLKKKGRWLLYSEVFTIHGRATVEARAHRIGWKASETARLEATAK